MRRPIVVLLLLLLAAVVASWAGLLLPTYAVAGRRAQTAKAVAEDPPHRRRLFEYLTPETATVPFHLLSPQSPRALLFTELLNESECATLIELGQHDLVPSGVWVDPSQRGVRDKAKSGARTSSGVRLPSHHHLVKAIDRRLLVDVLQRQFKGTYAERVQLLRYEVGQRYNGHVDSFGGITGSLYRRSVAKRRKEGRPWKAGEYVMLERAVTMLIYLGAPASGGNTSLPYLTPSGKPSAFRAGKDDPCDGSRFMQVPPRPGSVLLFYDITPYGIEDTRALHMGCPVLAGTKFVATKWLMIPLPPPSAADDAGSGEAL